MEQYDSRCSLIASLPLVAQRNSLLLLETVEHNTIRKSLTFDRRGCCDECRFRAQDPYRRTRSQEQQSAAWSWNVSPSL